MKRIVVITALLTLLAACGTSPSPSASPSPPPSPVGNALTPSPAASPSVQPDPSPDEQPGDSDPVTQAFQNGELVIGADGAALNYQPWLDFTRTLGAGEDYTLTVCELGEDQAVRARGTAEKKGAVATWTAAAGLPGETGAAFSAEYADGAHRLKLDGREVLGFRYYPTVPAEVARFWSYTPLEEIPPFYTWNEALADGCFVLTPKAENIGMLQAFAETFGFDDGSFLRVCETTDEGDTVLTDISYNGVRALVTRDTSRDRFASPREIRTTVYDDCMLTLLDVDGGKELRLHDNQTGRDITLLTALE